MNISNRKSVVTAMLIGLIAFTLTLDADVSSTTAWVIFASTGLLAFSRYGWKGYMGVLLFSVVISDSTYGGNAVIGALGSVSVIVVAWMFGLFSKVASSTANTSIPGESINKAGKYRTNDWEPDYAVLCLAGTPMAYQTGHEIAVDLGGEVSFFD